MMNTKGEKTRRIIIDKATVLFTRYGFNHTSLSQILATTGIAKGGFYFHFKSKESLALAVIESLKECWAKEILPKLKEGKDARENLKLMFSAPGDCCNSSEGIRPTILLLNLATEMLEVNDKFSTMLSQIIKDWWTILEAIIEQGKSERIFRNDIDNQSVAAIILCNVMGANLLALLNKEPAFYNKQLSTFERVLFKGIEKN